MGLRIGIDLGGTKIEGVALDGGREVARLRVDTPRGDYDATLEAVASTVAAVERTAGASGSVGIGIPGAADPGTGLIKNANSVWLIGRTLAADLERRLGRAVRIANDANCFALSEATDGAAAGAGVVFGVIVGTGTGAGIVVDGRGLVGPNAIAGEWGHNPLPWPRFGEHPGPPCYCGKHGCIETFLSGPALAREYERATGAASSGKAVADLAAAGDAAALAVLERYTTCMARALAGVINVIDPDVIVLGGGMSNVPALYTDVPRRWGAWVFGATGGTPERVVRTRLVPAMHGDSSGVRGAAWLWPDTL